MNPNSFTSISDTTKIAILCGNKNDISKFQKFVTPYSNKYEFLILPRGGVRKTGDTKQQLLYIHCSNSIVNDECMDHSCWTLTARRGGIRIYVQQRLKSFDSIAAQNIHHDSFIHSFILVRSFWRLALSCFAAPRAPRVVHTPHYTVYTQDNTSYDITYVQPARRDAWRVESSRAIPLGTHEYQTIYDFLTFEHVILHLYLCYLSMHACRISNNIT